MATVPCNYRVRSTLLPEAVDLAFRKYKQDKEKKVTFKIPASSVLKSLITDALVAKGYLLPEREEKIYRDGIDDAPPL